MRSAWQGFGIGAFLAIVATAASMPAGAQDESAPPAPDRWPLQVRLPSSPRQAERMLADAEAGMVRLTRENGGPEWTLVLRDVEIGGVSLGIDPHAGPAAAAGGGFRLDRAPGIVETYTPVASGIEQTFRLDRPALPLRGALTIDLDLAVEGVPARLAKDRAGGLVATFSGAPVGLRYGAATVIDASGTAFPVNVIGAERGLIRILVPPSVLDAVAWPIVVDPFLDFGIVVNQDQNTLEDTKPDLAFDEQKNFDSHFTAWQTEVVPGEHEIHWNTLDADPASGFRFPAFGGDGAIFATGIDLGRPRVAYVASTVTPTAARFILVFDMDFSAPGAPDHDILFAVVNPVTLGAAGSITFPTAGQVAITFADERNPVIGVDAKTGTFLIAWEERDFAVAGSTYNIRGKAFKLNATTGAVSTIGTTFTISAENLPPFVGGTNPSNQTNAAVSARAIPHATKRAWAVVYEDDAWSVPGTPDRDLMVAMVPTATAVAGGAPAVAARQLVGSNFFLDDYRADVATVPDLAGAESLALVAYQVDFGLDQDVGITALEWDGVANTVATSPVDAVLSFSGDADEYPAVAHRFMEPLIPGEPRFMLFHGRSGTFQLGPHLRLAEIEVDTSGIDPELVVLGEQTIARGLGNIRHVRAQGTIPAAGFVEEMVAIQESSVFNNADIIEEQWIGPNGSITFFGVPMEDFETTTFPGALPDFPWTTSATDPWDIHPTFGNFVPFGTGPKCAIAGLLANGGSSTLSITLELAADGYVNFWHAEALDPFNEFLTFSIDGVEVGYWTGLRDVFRNDAFYVPAVGPGTHTFEWTLVALAPPLNAPLAVIDEIQFPDVPAPTVTLVTADPNPAAPGQNVDFEAITTGLVTEFAWDFGNGNTTTTPESKTVNAYAVVGTYPVSVTVTGPGGSVTVPDAVTVTVQVAGPGAPSITSISATPDPADEDKNVVFTATLAGGPATTFSWDFGDGGAVGTTNPVTKKYGNDGTFTVTLTVNGPGGADVLARTITVTPRSIAGTQIRSSGGGGGGGCTAAPFGAPAGTLLPLFLLVAGVAVTRRRRTSEPRP